MSAFLDFLTKFILPAAEAAGESELVDLLQDEHDSNLADWKATINLATALVGHLKPLVAKSKSPYDDLFVKFLEDTANMSSAANAYNPVAIDATAPKS